MKDIKVDSYWKNQSCCISKGIPSVFRSLSLISLHSSGELNHSLPARYWPNGLLTENSFAGSSKHVTDPRDDPLPAPPPLKYGFHLHTVTEK
jgi:hypothetical protein